MKFIFCVLVFSFSAALAQAGELEKTDFGTTIQKAKPVPLAEAVKNFEKYKNKKDLQVSAKVVKVCEKKGCWMKLEDGKTNVRTMFKDYGFFVPKEIYGKKVVVQGRLEIKEISAAAARHFLKDEGASMKEQTQIRTPQKKFQFEATGVKVI